MGERINGKQHNVVEDIKREKEMHALRAEGTGLKEKLEKFGIAEVPDYLELIRGQNEYYLKRYRRWGQKALARHSKDKQWRDFVFYRDNRPLVHSPDYELLSAVRWHTFEHENRRTEERGSLYDGIGSVLGVEWNEEQLGALEAVAREIFVEKSWSVDVRAEIGEDLRDLYGGSYGTMGKEKLETYFLDIPALTLEELMAQTYRDLGCLDRRTRKDFISGRVYSAYSEYIESDVERFRNAAIVTNGVVLPIRELVCSGHVNTHEYGEEKE